MANDYFLFNTISRNATFCIKDSMAWRTFPLELSSREMNRLVVNQFVFLFMDNTWSYGTVLMKLA
jgi:hypothetical protein